MAFAYEPKSKGDEEKAAAAVRRLTEEDPTLDVHRDAQTGEQIIAGLTQVHVEVIVERMKRRFGVEIELHPPRVPYQETIRRPGRAHARYKKQSGGRGQFADCQIEIEPAEDGAGFEFVNQIKGAAIPGSFIPAVEKGVVEAMEHGTVAGYPVKGVRVRLVDGKHHDVDSSEMAFKIAGSMAFREAMEEADPVLLEPIVRLTVSCPEDVVGDVIGDLNSRRGHPLGMEPKGATTEVQAEVPMAEVLDYAPDLRSISGGRADFEMEFDRYEEVPAHLATRVVAESQREAPRSVRAAGRCYVGDVSKDRACPAAPGATVGRRRRSRDKGGSQARLELAVESFNASRESRAGGRADADPGRADGLGRGGGGLAERGPDHRRLGALLVPVGGRRRPAIRARRADRQRSREDQLDGSARQWNGGAAKGGELFLGRPRRDTPAVGAAPAETAVKVVVNVDGGARGNPGPAAIAAVVQDAERRGAGGARRADRRATNNVAEYRALLLGIERAGEHRRRASWSWSATRS